MTEIQRTRCKVGLAAAVLVALVLVVGGWRTAAMWHRWMTGVERQTAVAQAEGVGRESVEVEHTGWCPTFVVVVGEPVELRSPTGRVTVVGPGEHCLIGRWSAAGGTTST